MVKSLDKTQRYILDSNKLNCNPAAAWVKIEKLFAGQKKSRQRTLMRQLYSLKMESAKDLQKFRGELNIINEELEVLGTKLDQSQLVHALFE